MAEFDSVRSPFAKFDAALERLAKQLDEMQAHIDSLRAMARQDIASNEEILRTLRPEPKNLTAEAFKDTHYPERK